MPKEIELKFTDINQQALRQSLATAGYECVLPETLMRRVVFNPAIPDGKSWARVRDEGHRITCTYKRSIDASVIDGVEEIEFQVNDFDAAVAFIKALGMKEKAYQETKREIWLGHGVEVCMDTWPGLKPFVEIEGQDEALVYASAAQLGFDKSSALFGSVDEVYRLELGIPHDVINNHTPLITFATPPQRYVTQ